MEVRAFKCKMEERKRFCTQQTKMTVNPQRAIGKSYAMGLERLSVGRGTEDMGKGLHSGSEQPRIGT